MLLGAPRNEANKKFLYAWWHFEGGNGGPKGTIYPTAKYNWLNSTTKVLGSTSYNSVGVQNYPTYISGLYGTHKTLKQDKYADIRAALKSGNPTATPPLAGLST